MTDQIQPPRTPFSLSIEEIRAILTIARHVSGPPNSARPIVDGLAARLTQTFGLQQTYPVAAGAFLGFDDFRKG